MLVGFAPTEATAQAPQVHPDSSLIPDTSLGVGDSFRLLFLTSEGRETRTAAADSFQTYNDHVITHANNSTMDIRSFSGQFSALVSFGATRENQTARFNTGTTGTGVPIYWLDGAKVADDYDDFYDGDWDSIEARNEDGNVISNPPFVWTGSEADGTHARDAAPTDSDRDRTFSRALGASLARVGRLDGMVGELVATLGGVSGPIDGRENESDTEEHSFYALSPVISIIATPDPRLSGLVLSGDPPMFPGSFHVDTTDYAASVPNDITNFTITPTFDEPDATATIAVGTAAAVAIASGAASEPIMLVLGNNDITIEITVTDLGRTFTTTYSIMGVTRLDLPLPAPLDRHILADSSAVPPSGLGVGDRFRLLFVGGSVDITNTDISHYNSRVISEVGNNGHATIRTFSDQFRALVSTREMDARDNTATRDTSTSVPIYWVNGNKVADSYADFYDGNWDSHSPTNSAGDGVSTDGQILTGSLQSGRGQPRSRIGDSDRGIRVGQLNRGEGNEIGSAGDSNQVFRLYGLSPIITLLAAGPQPPLVWYPIPDRTEPALIPFSYTFPANTFHDLNMDTLTYSVTGPDWLSINSDTRTLSGTPPSAAFGQPAATIIVTANDGDGDPATLIPTTQFMLTVSAGRPVAPTNVSAVAGDGSITVSWGLVTEGGGHPVQSYLVQVRQTNPAGGLKECPPVNNNFTNKCTITGLMNGVQYANIRVTVRAGPSATDIPFTSSTSLGGNYILTPTAGTLDSNAFITTWRTTAANQTITIPINSVFTYDYTVDWGDGTASTDHTETSLAKHTYTAPGTYTIAITGTFPQIHFNGGGDITRIFTVKQWGTIAWSSMENSFTSCSNLVIEAGAGRPDLRAVTSMRRMFLGATIINQPLGDWDVSKVTDMAAMFQNARAFNQDLSNWKVGAVRDMNRMFNGASAFNQPIGGWDVGAVTDMTAMFNEAAVFNQDLSNWNVSAVTGMAEMFRKAATFNQNLGAWDVGLVGSMSNMLEDVTLSRENYDSLLVGWGKIEEGETPETGETPLRQGITFGAGNSQYCDQKARDILTEPPNSWTIIGGDERATNCSSPPPPADAFVITWAVPDGTDEQRTITIPINIDTGVHDYTVDWGDGTVPTDHDSDAMHTYTAAGTYTIAITDTFRHIHFNGSCSAAIRTIEQWGDIAWLSMENSFNGCNNLTIAANAGAPDLSMVTSIRGMFRGAASLNSPVNHWDVSSVTNMANMFHDASVFNQDLSDWDVSNVANMDSMFNGATAFNQNLGAWDVSSVATMDSMFNGATAFNQNLGAWDVSSVATMDSMFNGATAFNQNLGAWDVSSADHDAQHVR